jgi:hypothetical protein
MPQKNDYERDIGCYPSEAPHERCSSMKVILSEDETLGLAFFFAGLM